MNSFLQSVLVLTVVATTVAETYFGDVHIDCSNEAIGVAWKVSKDVDFTRVFLGSCFSSRVVDLPDGSMEIAFRVRLHECRIRREITGKWVIYTTTLTYKPLPKRQPPVFTAPIECAYRRPKDLFPGVQDPAFGTAFGHGSVLFYMEIANGDFTGPALSSTFYLGTLIPIWAAVDQQAHLPLLLLLDECVAATSPDPDPSGPVYPIITNGGCLRDSRFGSSRFQPRRRSSELLLLLQAFRFAMGQEVYLHCKIVAWDPQGLNKNRKACHYNKQLEGWELLDDPSQSSLCSCCDSHCLRRDRRSTDSGAQGVTYMARLGPLTIIDRPRGCKNSESEECPVAEGED